MTFGFIKTIRLISNSFTQFILLFNILALKVQKLQNKLNEKTFKKFANTIGSILSCLFFLNTFALRVHYGLTNDMG